MANHFHTILITVIYFVYKLKKKNIFSSTFLSIKIFLDYIFLQNKHFITSVKLVVRSRFTIFIILQNLVELLKQRRGTFLSISLDFTLLASTNFSLYHCRFPPGGLKLKNSFWDRIFFV